LGLYIVRRSITTLSIPFVFLAMLPHGAKALVFTPGDLVISVEGNGNGATLTTPYLDGQAAPITLDELTTSGLLAGQLVLPTVASGSNFPIVGEYGSSSEGTLQLSGNGQLLTIAGYDVNIATYNANQLAYLPPGTTEVALAQTLSTQVPRVIATINASGVVNSSTALTNVYNEQNPRSVYTLDGSGFYISGQGTKGDNTAGVFYALPGATTATPITGNDTTYKGSPSSFDTRDVQIVNGQLYVSYDTTVGSNQSGIGTIGSSGVLPTTAPGASGLAPVPLPGISNTVKLQGNSVNGGSGTVNLSPENFFFANATTLYVADSGDPKSGGLGDGGLQKWSLVNGTWQLDYTISAGLSLAADTQSDGVSGLLGLTGEVVGNQVDLYATSYTLADLDEDYLYAIQDPLAATTLPSGESFSTLFDAPADSTIKGVAFAPVPEPGTLSILLMGLAGVGILARRRA
jgi:hypothetical protein